jgi:hypothetical protein
MQELEALTALSTRLRNCSARVSFGSNASDRAAAADLF